MWKSRVFISCSSEAKNVVSELMKALYDYATPIPWWASKDFTPTHSTLNSLLNACRLYDFGIFVLTPDDVVESRETKEYVTRDNVLFEFGLFLGRLGPERVFACVQGAANQSKRVKMPSDLLGIQINRFDNASEDQLTASIQILASKFGPLIVQRGPIIGRIKLVGSFGFDSTTRVFSMALDDLKVKQSTDVIKNNRLMIVARKADGSRGPTEDDTHIAIGNARRVGPLDCDIVLSVECADKLGELKVGDTVHGYVVLVPDNSNIQSATTIGELLSLGCEILDRYGNDVRATRKKREGKA